MKKRKIGKENKKMKKNEKKKKKSFCILIPME